MDKKYDYPDVVVVIEDGTCVDVRGLPEGWEWEVENYDVCDNARFTVREILPIIAAAPELLEALEQVTELFQWSESGSAEERAYDVARAAIAKAKAKADRAKLIARARERAGLRAAPLEVSAAASSGGGGGGGGGGKGAGAIQRRRRRASAPCSRPPPSPTPRLAATPTSCARRRCLKT